MEENEVSGIQWIPIEDIKNYKWVFWHDRLLNTALNKLEYVMKSKNGAHSPYSYISHAIEMLRGGADSNEVAIVLNDALGLLK